MTFTVRRSILVVLVSLVVVAAGVFVSQRAAAASSTPVVYVATGSDFPDALGAASAAAVNGGPVLLVTKTSIPAETAAELVRLAPDTIYIAGGRGVVSDAVESQLGAYAASVVRVAGANRYETAVEVSKSAFPAAGGGFAALEARVTELETSLADLEVSHIALEDVVIDLEADNAALQALLAGVSRDGDALLFTGMNLQVVNGTDTTDGIPNGLGNLIVGYNAKIAEARTGSHYLVVGDMHSYSGFGGAVIGYGNTAGGDWASVTGGAYNTAAADYSSVSGGNANTAGGDYSSVSGGSTNSAGGDYSSATGGFSNHAIGHYSAVLGGSTQTVVTDYVHYPPAP